ncbi:hypothetical protein SAMN02745181_0013 [Rubritalea squalenifaciens DSM 18772]|uniref:Uncharacterized protein n=1 Tax=Rubritalea squalenifaciens DSM 18772 TaxID=1123071 RepID=A0A1M6SXX4_9BACT|nr:hypothetical protein SAMN02745181_0013 [Rubritalea squalenifaciens DSM 18772]
MTNNEAEKIVELVEGISRKINDLILYVESSDCAELDKISFKRSCGTVMYSLYEEILRPYILSSYPELDKTKE